jgi:hypothetical protein
MLCGMKRLASSEISALADMDGDHPISLLGPQGMFEAP